MYQQELTGLFITFGKQDPIHNSWKYCKCELNVKAAQSCLTLCDPTNYSVHGILQARTLEWAAVPFPRGSYQPKDWT